MCSCTLIGYPPECEDNPCRGRSQIPEIIPASGEVPAAGKDRHNPKRLGRRSDRPVQTGKVNPASHADKDQAIDGRESLPCPGTPPIGKAGDGHRHLGEDYADKVHSDRLYKRASRLPGPGIPATQPRAGRTAREHTARYLLVAKPRQLDIQCGPETPATLAKSVTVNKTLPCSSRLRPRSFARHWLSRR